MILLKSCSGVTFTPTVLRLYLSTRNCVQVVYVGTVDDALDLNGFKNPQTVTYTYIWQWKLIKNNRSAGRVGGV